MILYAKHLVLMSLALFIVPIIGLVFARAVGARHRMRRPGITFGLLAFRLFIALIVPIYAQMVFQLGGNRYFSLVLAGALYGQTFGHRDDFPQLPAVIWGILGGLGSAYLFHAFDGSPEGRALCVAVIAISPLLAYRSTTYSVRRRLGSRGLIQPSRRILR